MSGPGRLEDLEGAQAYRNAMEVWEGGGRATMALETLRRDHQGDKGDP